MCILKLKSTNPNLSYILFKNPVSGMQLRSIRHGCGHGYYNKEQDSYLIYFQDGNNTMSYKEYPDQQFEYLNKLKYMSTVFVLNAITEFFAATTKAKHIKDTNEYTNTIFINLVQMKDKGINFANKLNKFFDSYNIELNGQLSNAFQITITTNKSIYELLHFCNVYFSLMSISNESDMDICDDFIEKIIKSTNIIEASYFVRYTISTILLNSREKFKKHSAILGTPTIKLYYGNTAIQRRDFVKSLLTFTKPIIDIGCNDGFNSIHFANQLQRKTTHKYYAIDTDPNQLKIINTKAKSKELQNIITLNNVEDMLRFIESDTQYEILITEVIEHMTVPEAQTLVRFALQCLNYSRIIITTPNAAFNKNYKITGFRHDDHKYEFNPVEFIDFINSVIDNDNYEVLDIGDSVDNITFTQGVIIQKKVDVQTY